MPLSKVTLQVRLGTLGVGLQIWNDIQMTHRTLISNSSNLTIIKAKLSLGKTVCFA